MAEVAVVSGGSSGIGAAIARALAERGWQLVLVARGEERLRAVAEELGAEWESCDVGDRAAVEHMAAAVRERHPQIRLLVNGAGIPGRGGFLRAPPERIEEVTRTDYLGGVWCLRAFLPALEAAAPSHVVNVVSVAGTVAAGAAGPYTAAKHAQLAFSRATRAELRPRGIHVHTILPGFVETPGFPQRSRFENRLVRAAVVEPEVVARRVVAAVEDDRAEVFVPRFYRVAPLAQARISAMNGPPSPDEVAAVAEFRAALRRFLRTTERNARSAGLTPQRYLLLLMIKGAADRSERSTVTELAERLQLAQSTVTELVSRAEENGLIERERSASDGRIAYLRLSGEGERRLAESFTSNESERRALREAFEHLETGVLT